MLYPHIQCHYFPFPHPFPISLTRFEGISYGEGTRKRRLTILSNGILLFKIRKWEVWALKIWDFTIKVYCASDFGVSIQKNNPSGNLLFALNMVYLQRGLLPSLLHLSASESGNILELYGICWGITPHLGWAMEGKLVFGMMHDLVILLGRICSLFFSD